MRTFSLPDQKGNAGKFLQTDGQNVLWATAGGGGGGVTSLNTLTGAVILAAGTGITLTPAGQTITIAATGGSGGMAIGSPVTSGDPNRVLFIDVSGNLAQSDFFQYIVGTHNFVVGWSEGMALQLSGTGTWNYRMGDIDGANNQTYLDIDDSNRTFDVFGKYAGLGNAPGLKMDFANQTFGLGDSTGAANGTNLFVNDATQKVGINTVNPNAALDVHIIEQPVIGTAQFSGTGTDDLTSGGSMGGNATLVKYTITITDGDPTSPNQFSWVGDDGTAGSPVDIDGTAQAIGVYGVTATWASTTGHNTGDVWTIQITQPLAFDIISTQGTSPFNVGNDGTTFLQNGGSGNDVFWYDPTGGSIGALHFGDVDISVDGGGFEWAQTDPTDPTLWNFNIHGSVSAGHIGTTPATFFRTEQSGVTVIGDVDSVFEASIVGTQFVVDPANEFVQVFVGGSGSGNGTFEVMTSASATVAPAGYSNLYVNPSTDLFAAGDWNQVINKTAMYIDDAAQTINFKTDGDFSVIGATSNKTLFGINGTNEQINMFGGAIVRMYDSSGHATFLANNGNSKVILGDPDNNVDDFHVEFDGSVSTPNSSQGTMLVTGFHGDVALFYTDGIQFDKPFSQTYGSQTFTPVNGHLDVGTNSVRLTSATTITLLGVNNATGSQWYTGAEIELILEGGQIVQHNQTTATGFAPMLLIGNVDYQSQVGDVMKFTYNGANWVQTGLMQKKGIRSGSFTATGTATTTFTVTIGVTMPNSTYKVTATPSNVLSAAVFYVNNKTSTTFDVVYLAGLTGAVAFDWIVSP